MPYGIKNETPEQTKWMEKCVSSISGTNKRTGKPYTKSEKIAICKVQLKKTGVSDAYSEESLRDQFYEFEEKLRNALRPNLDMVQPGYGPYVVDIFDEYVIIEKSDNMYKLPYNMSGDEVTFDWSKAIEVERVITYEPVKQAETQSSVPKIPIRNGGRIVTYGGRTVN